MIFNNTKKYVTVKFSDVNEAMVDQCIETNINTLRHTISGEDRVILKWNDGSPSDLALAAPSVSGPYTHEEILNVLVSGSDGGVWQEGDS